MSCEIIILFAVKKEAEALLFHSKYKFIKEDGYYSFNMNKTNIKVFITGIGREKAVRFAEKNSFANAGLIIKAGTCAVLGNDTEILKPFIPSFVIHDEDNLKINLSGIPVNKTNGINGLISAKGLITVDRPLTDKKKGEDYLKKGAGFADMETFHLLKKYQNIPFIPLMTGTDRADRFTLMDFLKNLKKASEILKDEIINLIDNL